MSRAAKLKRKSFFVDERALRRARKALGVTSDAEVDFLVACDRRPWFAVEAKLSEERVDPSISYFQRRLKIPWAYQVVLEGRRDYVRDSIRCLPAHRFLGALI